MNSKFNSDAKIYVYDRYGKLLKNIQPDGQGWDGTFNNGQVPSDDYWYVLKLDATQAEIRGHFTLKR